MIDDYWISTKSPVHLLSKRDYESPELAKHVSENVCVAPEILVTELKIEHLSSDAIRAYQRRLGVRKLTGNGRRAPQL